MKTCKTCGETLEIEHEGKIYHVACKCQREKDEAEEREFKERQRIDRFRSNQLNSLMADDYINANFETAEITDENKAIYEKAKNYCRNFGIVYLDNHGIYIFGDNSTGKTYLSACMANELMAKGVTVLFTSLQKIVNETFNDKFIMDKIERASFLFLDDLGKEFMGREFDSGKAKYAEQVLKQVLDLRVGNKKPIVITSNYKFNELANELKFDRAIMERLNVAITREWELKGTNFRQKVLQEKLKKAEKLGI